MVAVSLSPGLRIIDDSSDGEVLGAPHPMWMISYADPFELDYAQRDGPNNFDNKLFSKKNQNLFSVLVF